MSATPRNLGWKTALDWITRASWALFLLCLPVTSFPYLPSEIGGAALVRPLSIYPLIVLLLVAVLPRVLTRPIPKTLITLAPFIFIALASSLLSTQRGIEPVLGVTVSARVLRALFTLGIGCAIYLAVSLLPLTREDLRASLRWMYAGFILALFWGSLQAVYVIHFVPAYFKLMNRLQAYISTRKIFDNRVSGMTYEPNWFAIQLSALLIPWLLASVLTGESVFRWRWRRISVEWLLLGWAILILIFTFSRAGLVTLVVLLGVSVLFFRGRRSHSSGPQRSALGIWARRLVEAGVVLSILVGGVYLASSRNAYFTRLWNYFSEVKQRDLNDYLDYIGFGARSLFAETAYNIYKANPIIGVGLGNYAFYFEEMMPDRFLAAMPEVLRLLVPEIGRNRLITPKNFFFRLLAETGLLGVAAFLSFLIAILGCTLYLWFSQEAQPHYWGLAGLLALVGFLISSFSFDSFAIPNMWVAFGLVTSAFNVFAHHEAEHPSHLQGNSNNE